MKDKVNFIILAAGKGSRFGLHPKVLLDLFGRTCLEMVVSLTGSFPTVLVINNIIKDKIKLLDFRKKITIRIQEEPKGTGDAFEIGLPSKDDHAFLLFGDSPLISPDTIKRTLNLINTCDIVFGIFKSNKLNQYGRVIKLGTKKHKVVEYSEHPESSEFYNAGWICFNRNFLKNIPKLNLNTPEKYITSYIELGDSEVIEVDEEEAIGINTPEDYYTVKEKLKWNIIKKNIMKDVLFLDPSSTHISWDTEIGPGSVISGNVHIEKNVKIGKENKILPYSFIENVKTSDNCIIGPFTYIHNTNLEQAVHLGAFCEINRSHIGSHSKAKHLSYIGDAQIGRKVNVGAGTVFCNYDGIKKSQCIIEDEAFLGSNCSYVAPIKIGKGAFIGAGTVVRQDIKSGTLYVANPNYIEYKK